MIRAALFCLLISLSSIAKSQILISLLFGDKLNSDKIEFGLDGGFSSSIIESDLKADSKSSLFLGLYFDFRLSPHSFIHTGFIIKSPMGAKNLNSYSIGEPRLDSLLEGGSVQRNLDYLSLPVFLKYKFDSNIFLEIGPQVGFLTKAGDLFTTKVNEDDDLSYTNNILDDLNRWDLGVCAGVGYKLLNGRGINLGLRYYIGLVDINNSDDSGSLYNRNLYVFAGIPIGSVKK